LRQVSGGTRFRQIGRLGGDRGHVVFDGTFRGDPVTWDVTLYTLRYFHARRCEQSCHANDVVSELRQFIEVGEAGRSGRSLEIGLAVDAIDRRTVLKAMIMIRQYRRLHEGRHEFGPVHMMSGCD